MNHQHPAQTRTGPRVPRPYAFIALPPPSLSGRLGSSTRILIDCRLEGLLTVGNYARRWNGKDMRSRCRRQLITFDMLPDDVLLEIFGFYVDEDMGEDFEWITLVHVCQRWRSVVFRSPRRLNLRLLCTPHTRARDDTLDIWPLLPLVIHGSHNLINRRNSTWGIGNIISVLEHSDRVCQIELIDLTSSTLEYVTDRAMQKPFPELTHMHLRLSVDDGLGRILPDSFLGRTAPRLRSLQLEYVPFPGLTNLLLSATNLVDLDLDIPRSGYIPPEVMATSLSALTKLDFLRLHFRYPRPRPALRSRRPPLLTRSTLPSLTMMIFKGASEYLEEILARVDVPRVDELHITFFNQIIFDTPQLFQHISRRPTLRVPERGDIKFSFGDILVELTSQPSDYGVLTVQIPCRVSEWQLSSLEQVCTSSLPSVSTLEDLYIFEDRVDPPRWQDDVDDTLWLDLLRSFVAVKNLYLSEEFVPRVAPALQELVGGRTTEVLPTLERIFLGGFQPSGPLHKGVEKFVVARQLTALTNRPVTVSCWDRDSK